MILKLNEKFEVVEIEYLFCTHSIGNYGLDELLLNRALLIPHGYLLGYLPKFINLINYKKI